VVECHLAKVDVDGSNPFARSKYNRRHSQVAKAAVCKTVIHEFKSHCRLHITDKGVVSASGIYNPFFLPVLAHLEGFLKSRIHDFLWMGHFMQKHG
jgi:hypothetical protein